MSRRTRIKKSNATKVLKGKRLFSDFGGIGYYKILKIYNWEQYCEGAELPDGNHWFQHSMAKIKTEYGVVMKIPYIELGLRSVYADSGEIVLR